MTDVEKLREAIEEWRMSDEPQTELFAAIDAAGFAVVPTVATEEMACAGAANLRNYMTAVAPYPRTRAMYAAMLLAAPKVLA